MKLFVRGIRNLVFYILLILAAPCLLGQEEEKVEEKVEERGRRAWFVATSIPEDLENPVKVMSGKDLSEVLLSKRSIGLPVKISKDGVMRVVREVPNPEAPGEVKYEILAEALIAEGIKEALVILVPLREPKDGTVFGVKVQDLSKFKGGDLLYMNLTQTTIKVQLGRETIGLRKGAVRVHNVQQLAKPENRTISYHRYDEEKKKWELISASTIVIYPTRREICIFSWDHSFDRVDYHGVTFPVAE